jgi:hypothetical protein
MVAPDTFFLRPLTTHSAVTKIAQLASAVFQHHAVRVDVQCSLSSFNQNVNIAGPELSAKIEPIVKNIDRPGLDLIAITFSIPNAQKQVRYSVDLPYQARITFSNIDRNEGERALQFVQQTFEIVPELQLVQDNVPKPQQEALRLQEAAVNSLSVAVQKISEYNLEQIAKQNEFILNATAELQKRFEDQERKREESFQKRIEGLEERRRQLDDEHRQKLDLLEERERDLGKRIQEIDLRENTAVRRTLLKEMEGLIEKQQQFSLSANTNRKRGAVWRLFVAAFVVTTSLVAVFGYKYLTTLDLHYLATLSAGTIGLVSTLIWCIKWNDQWFKEHARAEIRNKRFASDILRASWLAELFFETKDKNIQIPEPLITEFSRGLFQDDQLAETQHPADQMAELISRLSSVKVGAGNIEVTRTPK